MNRLRSACTRMAVLALVAASGGAAAGAPGGAAAPAPGDIWSGTSAGFHIRWTAGDIDVRRGDRREFSARDWASAGLAHFISTSRGAGSLDCNYRHEIRIIAVVGALMSLEDTVDFSCRKEAHPGGMKRLLTVDLGSTGSLAQAGRESIGHVDPQAPGRALLLTGLFPTAEVVAALAAAPPLREVLHRAELHPVTLPTLLAAVIDANGEGDTCYSVPSDLLAAFSFDRVEGEHVIMRLGLPGDGPCRMNLTTAELSFAIPAALSGALQKAADGVEGFLADRGEAIAAGRVTTINLTSGRGRGP